MRLTLTHLNDDVLRLICNEIFGKDALHLALTSKHMHDHAIRRVVAAFRTWDPAKLRRFHQHVLHGSRPRAHYVESIIIYWDTFCEGEGGDDEVLETLHLLIELLHGAHHLRRLSLDSLHILLRRDAGLAPTLKSLRHLHHAEFDTVADSAVELIGQTGWDIHVLSLEYDDDRVVNRKHIEGEANSYPVLLKTLSSFCHLHTLKIASFRPLESFRDIPNFRPPVLHSVRKLFLWTASPFALDLTDLCPNALLIHFELDDVEEIDTEPRPGLRWPALRSLTLDSLQAVQCTERRLNTAYHFQIVEEVPVVDPDGEDAQNISRLLDALCKVSPVRAHLWMEVGAAPMRFWKQVALSAPRLRYLELKVSLSDLKEEYASWLENIPDSLRPLPLTFLRLHLPKLPPRNMRWLPPGGGMVDPLTEAILKTSKALSHELHLRRISAWKTMPQRLAEAIPTLRLLAIADEGPSVLSSDGQRDGEGAGEGQGNGNGGAAAADSDHDMLSDEEEWSDGSEMVDGDDDVYFHEQDDYETQGAWYSEKLKALRWWRVLPDNTGAQVQELAAEEGQRMQDFLDDWSYDRVERIDEILGA